MLQMKLVLIIKLKDMIQELYVATKLFVETVIQIKDALLRKIIMYTTLKVLGMLLIEKILMHKMYKQ